MIMFNLVHIGDATSLHTSAPMVQKWPKNLQDGEDFMVVCLLLGLARSLCASPTPCNVSVLWFYLGTLLFLLFLENTKIRQTSSAQDL